MEFNVYKESKEDGTTDAVPAEFDNSLPGWVRAMQSDNWVDFYTPNHDTCANNGCFAAATLNCSGCFLVKYCGKDCQKVHRKSHKADCRGSLKSMDWKPKFQVEKRLPDYAKPEYPFVNWGEKAYLWGNVPAADVLNLKNNEGLGYNEDIGILFAGSGDLRNVVRTINSLPEDYKGLVTVAINDVDVRIITGNTLLLLLALTAATKPEKQDILAEALIQLWYSAAIPSLLLDQVRDALRFELQEPRAQQTNVARRDDNVSARWVIGRGSMSVEGFSGKDVRTDLRTLLWRALGSNNFHEEFKTNGNSVALHPIRADWREMELYLQPPGWRAGTVKWRESGIVLPAGAERDGQVANRLLFAVEDDGKWSLPSNANPLKGWDVRAIVEHGARVGVPKNDIYGCLHAYLRAPFMKFFKKLASVNAKFRIIPGPAQKLQEIITSGQGEDGFTYHNPKVVTYHIPKDATFDRIDVSNLVDGTFVGIEETLISLAPLLKPKHVNPHAVLIGSFLRLMNEELPAVQAEAGSHDAFKRRFPDFASPVPFDPLSVESLRQRHAFTLSTNYEALFQSYADRMKLNTSSAKAKLVVKKSNTVIDKWAWDLRRKSGEDGFEEELRLLMSIPDGLIRARYVEWGRQEGTYHGAEDQINRLF